VLEELGLAEKTLVIFSSDNGGVGGYAREGLKRSGGITDNTPLRGGKGMLYEGGVRVPYIFRWPGTAAAGTVCEEPVNSVDLFPTLLEIAGAEPPAQVLDGRSCVGLLDPRAPRPPARDGIYWHFPGYLGAGAGSWRTTPAGAVRSGDWKLIEFFEDNRLELYNLRDDPGETRNRAADLPDKARELHARLQAWRRDAGARMPTANNATEQQDQPRPRNAQRRSRRNQRSPD
jgi:arylsulfatase A-like enzyme